MKNINLLLLLFICIGINFFPFFDAQGQASEKIIVQLDLVPDVSNRTIINNVNSFIRREFRLY